MKTDRAPSAGVALERRRVAALVTEHEFPDALEVPVVDLKGTGSAGCSRGVRGVGAGCVSGSGRASRTRAIRRGQMVGHWSSGLFRPLGKLLSAPLMSLQRGQPLNKKLFTFVNTSEKQTLTEPALQTG